MDYKSKVSRALTELPEFKDVSFPLSEEKLAEMVKAIKTRSDLPCPPRPDVPRLNLTSDPTSRHRMIQKYIEGFEYNFTGENFFNVKGVRQNQSLFRVLEVAKRVIRECLPIKCVEAVYLGIYLTQTMSDIERLPVIFNSEIDGHKYGHIVLVIRYNCKLGAIGLSRRPDLMFKECEYNSLSEILLEYKRSYERWSHRLHKIKIGNLIPHEGSNRLNDIVDWANTVISLKTNSWEKTDEILHKKARILGWEPRELILPVCNSRSRTAATADKALVVEGDEKKIGDLNDDDPDGLIVDDPAGASGAASANVSRPSFLGV
mmetsp:Transcript_15410/g.51727  ORF Transcript_15410/g.51727 Transcript_15410/m.51727 type:complete len:318 (-) Transcript_15410:152-1105(-)